MFAEAIRAMTPNDGLSRVVAGITRLCEAPFQQAWARMPLDKLAPENQEEARQRLFAVVEREEGRIGRIRAMLQKIADADLAEAPIRLAFETGTEGDRGRRYILSYERLVNRRIDTFLKVRKASGSGELDLVELEKTLGTEKLAELVADARITTFQDPGDLRSGDGRGQETRAQHAQAADAGGESSAVSQCSVCALRRRCDFAENRELTTAPGRFGWVTAKRRRTPPVPRPPRRGLSGRASSTPADHLLMPSQCDDSAQSQRNQDIDAPRRAANSRKQKASTGPSGAASKAPLEVRRASRTTWAVMG